MKKLYKTTGNKIEYAEAWVHEGDCVFHWGVLGSRGESRNVAQGKRSDHEIIEMVLADARANGFQELTSDQHSVVIISRASDETDEEDNATAIELYESILNEELGWTGNGRCEGAHIEDGLISVFALVVDVDLALQAIMPEMGEIGMLDGATVRSRSLANSEPEFVTHNIPDEYQNHPFNEPEKEIVPSSNQQEWENEKDPDPLLAALSDEQLTDRKCWLFGVACCRRVWELFIHEDMRAAVEYIEDLVDGKADKSRLEEVAEKAGRVFGETSTMGFYLEGDMETVAEMDGDIPFIKVLCELAEKASVDPGAVGDAAAALDSVMDGAKNALNAKMCAAWAAKGCNPSTTEELEKEFQADLVRCIFESPFAPPNFDTSWKSAEVIELANRMYETRDFSAMPNLGEHLNRNGCTDSMIQAQTQSKHHARGSWLIDWCRA